MQKTPLVKALRVARVEKDLNQYDTARKSKISHNRYWRIENGYAEPTDEERARIARTLGKSVPDLFGVEVSA